SDPLDKLRLLIDAKHLSERIQELADQIVADFPADTGEGEDPVIVVVLKGGFLFGADLLKALARPVPVVFIPHRDGGHPITLSQQDLEIIHDRHLVVVDALLDTGGTMRHIIQYLEGAGTQSIRLAVLLHRSVGEDDPLPVNYLGFEVPNVRLVGYGLDEGQRFRGMPEVYTWWEPGFTDQSQPLC
ncbi:MAG: hypothetical protein HQL53_13855, partial [Magnetococcales bacterium]|nr:hypothetical protein [Magnetococcales bacterium]